MAQLTSLRGTQLYIKIGNGASPEVFAHPCFINTDRGAQFQTNGQDIAIPDCDDPDGIAWNEYEKMDQTVTLTGSGILDNVLATIQFYDLWFRDPDPRNVQIWLGTVGKWPGAFHLTEWSISAGGRGTKAEVSISLKSNGVVGAFAA